MNWIGYKFDDLNPNRYNHTWIVKQIRESFKENFDRKLWKFSIAKKSGNTIRIRIVRAPKSAFDQLKLQTKQIQGRYLDINDLDLKVLSTLEKEANAWNYDNSEIMTDYFDRNYYLRWVVGSVHLNGKEVELV